MGVKGKAGNRMLFLNPGQVLYSLDQTDLIALKACLFDCKMFCVANNRKIKTGIKIPYPPNPRVAGQVNLKALNVGRLSSCDGMTWMCL